MQVNFDLIFIGISGIILWNFLIIKIIGEDYYGYKKRKARSRA